MNTTILFTKIGGILISEKKSVNNGLYYQNILLWQLGSQSPNISTKLISKSYAVGMVMAMVEVRMPGHTLLVTIMARREI